MHLYSPELVVVVNAASPSSWMSAGDGIKYVSVRSPTHSHAALHHVHHVHGCPRHRHF
jgi:hypothetical protein